MSQKTAEMQNMLGQQKAKSEDVKSQSEMQNYIEDMVVANQKRKSEDSSNIRLDIDVKLAMLELSPTLEAYIKAGDFSILPHALAEPKQVADLARQYLSKTKIKFKGEYTAIEGIPVEIVIDGKSLRTMSLDGHHTYRMNVFQAMVQLYSFHWIIYPPKDKLVYGEFCRLRKPYNPNENSDFEPMDRTLAELGVYHSVLSFYSKPAFIDPDFSEKDLWKKLSESNPQHEFTDWSEDLWKPWIVFVVNIIASQQAGYKSANEMINAAKEKFIYKLYNKVFYNCVVWLRKYNVLENGLPLKFTPKAAEAISGLEKVKKTIYYFPGFHWLSWLTNPPIISEFKLTSKVPQLVFPQSVTAPSPAITAATTIHTATAAFSASLANSSSAADTTSTSKKSNEKITQSNGTAIVAPTFTPALNAAVAITASTTIAAVVPTNTSVPTMEIDPAGTKDVCISINGSSMDLN